jgi:hypothetical protein
MEMTGGFQNVGGAPQAPQQQQQRPSFSQLVSLDPARALQLQQAQQAQLEQQQKQQQEKAKEIVLRAQYALRSDAPATLLRIGFPDLAEQLKTSGVDVDNLDDDTVRGYAETLIAQFGPVAGMEPAKPGEGPFGKINPSEYTPDSVAQFQRSGDYASLRKLADASDKDPSDKTFTRANVLRDEFNTLATPFTVVKASFDAIKATAKTPSAAGDIALLTSFMKLNDPSSSVKEGEFATAQNAGGVEDRIRAKYNALLNGERLTEKQRTDFVSQSKNLYESRASQYKQNRTKYTKLAERAKVDPLDVVGEEIAGEDDPAAPSGVGPAVGAVEDGYRFKGGNPADPNSWVQL